MMWRPAVLRMRNFQSFAEEEYSFRAGSALSIEGENLTDDGQKSNGSGKSAFADAIYYLLLGTSSTGKRDSELVRWGESCAELYLRLEGTFRGESLEISRKIYSKSKSAEISIIINGKDAHDRYSSVIEGNRLILELLGLSADDLRTYFLVSRERFVSFFDSPDSAKRNLLARFSSVDRLKTLQQRLQEEGNDISRKRADQISAISAANAKIEVYREQLDSIKVPDIEAMKRDAEEGISSIDMSIAEYQASAGASESRADALSREAECYARAVRRFQSIDYAAERTRLSREAEKLADRKRKISSEADSIDDEIRDLKSDSEEFRAALRGKIQCPRCSFEFNPGSDIDVAEAASIVEDVDKVTASMREHSESLRRKAEALMRSSEFALISSRQEELRRKESECENRAALYRRKASEAAREASRLKDHADSCRMKVSALNMEKETIKARIAGMKADDSWKEQRRQIESRMDECAEAAREAQEMIGGYDEDLSRIARWKERMEQFYVYLTNTALKAIEDRCNLFLQKIGSDLSVRLDGYRVLSTGKVKDNVTAMISRGAKEDLGFRCFSGGERGRLVFATILALQDMVNRESDRGLDLLMIDEVLDQVDPEGMKMFLKSIRDLGKTIFLTSQVRTEADECDVLLVRKENRVSTIVK